MSEYDSLPELKDADFYINHPSEFEADASCIITAVDNTKHRLEIGLIPWEEALTETERIVEPLNGFIELLKVVRLDSQLVARLQEDLYHAQQETLNRLELLKRFGSLLSDLFYYDFLRIQSPQWTLPTLSEFEHAQQFVPRLHQLMMHAWNTGYRFLVPSKQFIHIEKTLAEWDSILHPPGSKLALAGLGNISKVHPRTFRLDAALAGHVQQHVSFELAVTIRLPVSPVLNEEDLDKIRSGNLQVEWPEEADSVALRVHVSAPECQIHGDDSWSFRLKEGQDSPVHYFQLTPQQVGRIGIVVTVYKRQEWLGSTRLHTLAQEQVAGQVEVNVYSQPLLDNYSDTFFRVAVNIASYFHPGELRDLCFALNVRYYDVRGERHTDEARELVYYMVRRNRFPDLIAHCQQERPHVDWYALADMVPAGGDAP